MRRRSLFLFIFTFLFFHSSTASYASYITVHPDGELIVNVLADEDENGGSTMEVTKLAENSVTKTPGVRISKSNDTVQMVITNLDGTKELHIPEKTDTLIEIEERPETQKLSIGIQADQFFVRQKKYIALTNYPLSIDAQSAHLVATGASGDTLLSILPVEAAESTLRSGIVSNITDNTMQLVEEDNGLQYKISGEKVFSFLNIYDYAVPVDAYVSVADGAIEKIDSTTWYRFMNFLVG